MAKRKPKPKPASSGWYDSIVPSTKWLCTKERPMPVGQDPREWSHDFACVHEGVFHDKLRCKGCGYEVDAAKRA